MRLLSATLLLAWPLAAQGISVPATVDTLENGLRVIVHEDHSSPIVAVNTWYHVGSGSEKTGRTGFAHLFEHLMFMGSEHAPYPQFDRLLEAAGASNNGSTTEDRTNYYEWGPKSSLDLMLWLEADRMGGLLPPMDEAKVDAQRDIVKNERRQGLENVPYGKVSDVLPTLLYPAGHPYSWPVIGSMADLSAASLDDVKDFFRTWYAPNNAVLVVAGDVDRSEVLSRARKYFGHIPRGAAIQYPRPDQPTMARDTLVNLEDRVGAARLYYAFPTTPAWSKDDAALNVAAYVLSGARNSRLDTRLIHRDESASGVSASAGGQKLAGTLQIVATAKPGGALSPLQQAIDDELRRLATEGPTDREMQQARNAIESRFLGSIQTVLGKADQLNQYYFEIGQPDGFQRDLDRIMAVSADDVRRVVAQYLTGPRVIVGVVPEGRLELGAVRREVTP
ncbi:MAG TPA: pitrilysin family protein [Gemmatimonadales bacterium]|nr:pitrilysin family protein [Gemmatimonadales bacterium]